MVSNRLWLAALAVACVAAAAGGGYLALRQNAALPLATGSTTTPGPAATDRPIQAAEEPAGNATSKAATPVPTADGAPAPTPTVSAPAGRSDIGAPKSAAARAPKPASRDRTDRGPAPTRDGSGPDHPTALAAAPAPPLAPLNPPAGSARAVASFSSDASASATTPPADQRSGTEPIAASEPPEQTFQEFVVSADSVIGLQMETTISSESARIEDRVDAHVTRDLRVGREVAIPAGTRVLGSVTQVERGGKFKQRARLGIRFHTLVLADGMRLPISTDTIFREGAPPGNDSAARIGGATVGGAILGAILGGAKGATIGATTGAGAGTAAVAAGDRNAATLSAGTPMTARLLAPVTVTVEK
jgi:hypothetical protein